MNIELRKEQVFERKADKSGRISLPSKSFANKKIEVAVLQTLENQDNGMGSVVGVNDFELYCKSCKQVVGRSKYETGVEKIQEIHRHTDTEKRRNRNNG